MENQVKLTAQRIQELRRIIGKTAEEMASIIGISTEAYIEFESGNADFTFTFLHKCAKIFNVDITDLLTGENAKLTGFQIVRNGEGMPLTRRKGFSYNHLAINFKDKLSEPFVVTAPYDEALQDKPIALSSHRGEEFDYIIKGSLKIQIGEHIEVLHAGDSVYYNSEMKHGMIATGGEPCEFLAILTDDSGNALEYSGEVEIEEKKQTKATGYDYPAYVYEDFIDVTEDENGCLKDIKFKNTDRFNFAYDVVDKIAERTPDKTALVYVDNNKNSGIFTFADIKKYSSKTANYLKAMGIKKGDKVMLVLKRHYQFWFSMIALHKLGAVAIPATNQLVEKDFTYRFNAGDVSAILCTADGDVANQADLATAKCPGLKHKIIVGGKREGWHDFNEEVEMYSGAFARPTGDEEPCGEDPAIMFFTSGTTGYPKIATHSHTYSLGHFITARYWHNVDPDGLHLTISDTGWGKALWGKLYGQWFCTCAVFVYDFERFNSADILPMFKQYNITTFCAPPTMYRFFIKDNLESYDLSSLKYATVAGEALNPEVFQQFYKATSLKIMEGFGQTETTLTVANLRGTTPKPGSMGKPSPMYNIDIIGSDGSSAKVGEVGEIVVYANKLSDQCGLFSGYYKDTEKTTEAWHDGIYHTGDTAWRDEDGYFWYVGRTDDLIKSSGYRIGPFEIESVIMELPYVLECAVTAAPDPVRGQVVKATIVLVNGTEETDELKKEIQNYVKTHTAPYKYPRIVNFTKELPKTISGKIRRVELKD